MAETVEKIAWAPIRDRKILFARTKGQTLFYNTGGRREVGESDAQVLSREVMEEAGVALVPESIRLIQVFEGPCHGKPEGTLLRMHCYDAEAVGEPTPHSEIEELAWFTSADMQRTTDMGRTILTWYKAQNLID